ncbi:MAG: hypothetical protein F9K23_14420 [Bacteroidetes bacterium]|nr:MAG: hypothetical protein F9K23_14420 [Bacteroidota bacterium]
MVTVEVFKTNINKIKDAKLVAKVLANVLPTCKINFDLEDCDRILRIEVVKGQINCRQVITLVQKNGFTCEVLS